MHSNLKQAARIAVLSALLLVLLTSGILAQEDASPTTFTHTSIAENVEVNWTTIDHPLTNGNPDAMLQVTLDTPVEEDGAKALGVWYTFDGRWAIFNQDETPMDVDLSFTVTVVPPGENALVHTATAENIDGALTVLDHPLLNNNPDAALQVTQNWNPGGEAGTYNDATVGVSYLNESGQWAIFNEDGVDMPVGAAFNVLFTVDEAAVVDDQGSIDRVWTWEMVFVDVMGGMAWSPQGNLLAVGRDDGSVLVSDMETGLPTALFEVPSGQVADIVWSPDGTQLAAGHMNGEDGVLRIFDMVLGRDVAGFGGNNQGISSVAWSPDGELVAAGLGNGEVLLYDPVALEALYSLSVGSIGVSSVAWSPDGSALAAGLEDGAILVWERDSWEELASFQSGAESVPSLAWSLDGEAIAHVGAEGALVVTEVATGEALVELTSPGGPVTQVAWSPSGEQLAAGSATGLVTVWDAAGWASSTEFSIAPDSGFEGDPIPVSALAWSANSGRLAVATEDGQAQVRYQDFADAHVGWQPLSALAGEGGSANSAAWSADGSLIAVGAEDGTVTVWDAASQGPITVLAEGAGGINSVAWSADGTMLAAGGDDGVAWAWETESWEAISTVEGDGSPILSLAAIIETVYVGGLASGGIFLWDGATGQTQPLEAETPDDGVTSMGVSPDVTLLAVASLDGTVRVWDGQSGELVMMLDDLPPLLSLAWGPDSDSLLFAGEEGLLFLAQVSEGDIVQTLETDGDPITSVAWSPDGSRAVAGGASGTLFVWETASWTEDATVDLGEAIHAIDWSPDGSQLAIVTGDGTVQLQGTYVLNADGQDAASLEETHGYHQVQTIFAAGERRCLAVINDDTDLAIGATHAACGDEEAQHWKITPAGDDLYRLQVAVFEEENGCLAVVPPWEEAESAGAAYIEECDYVDEQLWRFVDAGQGYLRLQNLAFAGQNQCLADGRPSLSPELAGISGLNTCQNEASQLWTLVKLPEEEEAHHGPHWEYEGEAGPENWGEIGYHTCEAGTHQSPINITATVPEDLTNIRVNYRPSGLTILNNGHTVQANYAPGSFITVDGETYMLAQFHYHAPSEHVVDGQSFAAELHLVHTNGNRLAVIGVLLAEGDEANPAYQPFIANLPGEETPATTTGDEIDAAALLPAVQTTYRYSGSLTTPPCTEGVTWLVMTEPVTLSGNQLASLEAVFEGNNRPPQPVNNRPVIEDTTP
jgi:carbonic anhydrase